jgi:hypothetical protein
MTSLYELKNQLESSKKAQERDISLLNDQQLKQLPTSLYNLKKTELESNIQSREDKIKNLILEIDNFKVVSLPQPKAKIIKPKPKIEYEETEDSKERKRQKDYRYYYKQYIKALDTLPSYMSNNLNNMPNNKGYVWRGCWLLGEEKAERNQPLLIFEKRGNVLKIHEYTAREYKLYEKVGKENKRLIQTTVRRKFKLGKKTGYDSHLS